MVYDFCNSPINQTYAEQLLQYAQWVVNYILLLKSEVWHFAGIYAQLLRKWVVAKLGLSALLFYFWS